MSKPKSPPNGASPNTTDQAAYRNNPEVDAKIDAYIKENPKYWAYVQAMPRDRLERSVVLNEVQKIDRQQRIRDGVMKDINTNPQLKTAYETLVKNVPEELRDHVITQIASQARRSIARTQNRALTPA
jgi:hypothetical protein